MSGRLRTAAAGIAAASACLLGALGAQAAGAEEPQFYTKAPVGGAAPTEIQETWTLGTTFLEGGTSKARIECKKGSGSAVVDGPKSVKDARLNFVECETAGFGHCENHGTKEIETNNLAGELGLITSTKDGLRLKPENGAYLMEFPCGFGAVVVKAKGALIGEIAGAEEAGRTIAEAKFRGSSALRFAARGAIQKWTRFLGESSGQQMEAVVEEGSSKHEELFGLSSGIVAISTPKGDIGETT